jgi:hypothetical protein
MMKLKEHEKTNQDLKGMVQMIKKEMNEKQANLQKEKALEINQNLEDIMYDINNLVHENMALKEKKGVPAYNQREIRDRISKNLY